MRVAQLRRSLNIMKLFDKIPNPNESTGYAPRNGKSDSAFALGFSGSIALKL
jgi:hypothetical protein